MSPSPASSSPSSCQGGTTTQPNPICKSVFRKWSAQVMKNLIPTFLVVLCSYSSLYFPVISIDARGTLALLRSLASTHLPFIFTLPNFSILNVFLLNDGIRRNIPKLGYPTILDIWICGCFLATFFIRCISTIRKFKSCEIIFLPPVSSSSWC